MTNVSPLLRPATSAGLLLAGALLLADADPASAQVPSAETQIAQAVLAAKARASDAAQSVTRRAVHLHGAMGFTDECDIGLHLKRAVALSAAFGQAEALRLEFLARDRAA